MDKAGLFATRQGPCGLPAVCAASSRSEEHTSELQSRSDLVCRLLLEKKKKKKTKNKRIDRRTARWKSTTNSTRTTRQTTQIYTHIARRYLADSACHLASDRVALSHTR